MKVVYTAPNRAHHFFYAKAMYQKGILKAFVSGFSRLSPRSALPEIGSALHRIDLVQTIFLLMVKLRLPERVTNWFAYYAKVQQDKACRRYIDGADIFLFYNGSGLSTCKFAKRKKVITIVEVVNTHVDYQEQLLREEHRLLNLPFIPFHKAEKKRRMEEYEKADYIMFPSEFVKQSFLKYGFPEKKMVKVTYGYEVGHLTASNSSTQTDSFTVLYVGSISVRKGLRYLVQAFEKLNRNGKRLLIVGPLATPSGLEDLTLSPQIEFMGVLKGIELEQAYKSADIFCLPSIEDGFGLVIGEALSYGVPVIATMHTGAYEVIEEGKNGFIVPIRNVEAIHEKLSLLANDDRLLLSMKEAATVAASQLKGWEACRRQLINALQHCKNAEL